MAGDEELALGIHAVLEALAGGERVRRVVVARHRERDSALKPIIDEAKRRNIAVEVVPENWFRQFGSARHQHVAAEVPAFQYTPWDELRSRLKGNKEALVVLVDHVEDPQNLGAIMRAAEGAGADGLVIPDRRSAAVTAATRRSAAGAASHLAVARVPNLVRALEDLKSDGFWVSGLTGTEQAVPYTKVDYRGPLALVVGSEGKGLSRLAAEHCDHLVRIPMRGKVASLNAAAACAVVLYEVVRQRGVGL
jgi:23S rRNA (guanosine2251-2'-O)-methyltransferase